VSSVVTAPGGASSRPSRTTLSRTVGRRRPSRDFVAGLATAAVFCLIAFLAAGGVDLAPNTWVQVALVVIGGGAAIALIVLGGPGRAWGAVTLALFMALAGLTYASIAWSVQPANSWLEANRTLSYLAAFGAALTLARLFPSRWRALIGAIATAAAVVCGYALLVKVFPGTFDQSDQLGRLQAPFGYWNAVGLMCALGIVPCLWAGARRDGPVVLRALAAPAIAVLLAALVLAYSRGAVLAAVVGVTVWFWLAPLRLRSALILALGAAGGGAIAAWGLRTRGISADGVSLAARTSAGHSFGIVILVALILTAAAGWLGVLALDRVPASERIRRRLAIGLLLGVALIPVGGLVALAGSSRGFTGEVSHIWTNLTNANGHVGDQPSRLVDLSNSRPHYWSQAITLGEHHLLAGVGALGFATAQPGSAGPVWNPQHGHVVHAHGYLAETFADFGLIGLAVSLALLVAWALATARSLELPWPRRSPPTRPPPADERRSSAALGLDPADIGASAFTAERAGLVALLAVVITFGVHSLIDWTWFIPGTAVPALASAGWLVGRGPLSEPVGRRERRRRLSRAPGAAAVVASVIVIALVAAWVIVQPLRSSDSYSAAVTAAVEGHAGAALSDGRAAGVEDPVSVDPLFLLSQIYTGLGNHAAARGELVQATVRQPSNPQTWQQLGCYDYAHHDSRSSAELRRVVKLQPAATQAESDPAAYCAGAPG
jgi:O-Antigen ligase